MSVKDKKIRFKTVLISIGVLAVAFLILVAVLIYGFNVDNFLTKKTVKIVPYPAALINFSGIITINELENNLNAVKKFYENQDFSSIGFRVDFVTEDGKKRLKIKEKNILNKLIENIIIENLAKQKGIKITHDMISQEVDRQVQQYGNLEEVKNNLQNLYGWDMRKFEEEIVRPDMYKAALQKNIKETDAEQVKAKNKINDAMKALNNKESFAETAKKYSEGESASNGGELGWFSADQMVPEIAIAAFMLDKDSRSDIIESALGYHIIQVEDKKNEGGIQKIKLSQIFVRTSGFSEWLQEQEKNIKIYIPLKDFYWDNESEQVRFESKQLEEFEKNLNKNSIGDISVLF